MAEAGAGGAFDEGPKVLVQGTVVALNEQPIPHATIELDGAAVMTDESGAFEALVTVPYDIVVRSPDDPAGQSSYRHQVYLDVTRLDPKVYAHVAPDSSAWIAGKLTGDVQLPIADGSSVHAALEGPLLLTDIWAEDDLPDSLSSLNPLWDGTYTPNDPVRWYGPSSAPTTIVAVRVKDGTPLGFATAPLTLSAGVDVAPPLADVTLASPALRDFDLVIVKPDGVSCTILVWLGSAPIFESNSSSCSSGSFPIAVPTNVPEHVPLRVVLSGTVGYRRFWLQRELPGTATGLEVELPSAFLTVEQPDNQAQGTRDSVFEFTPVLSWVNEVEYCYTTITLGTGARVNTCYAVFTDSASIELRRLLDLGLDLPPDVQIRWVISGHSDYAGVNDTLEPSRIARASRSRHRANNLDEGYRTFSYTD